MATEDELKNMSPEQVAELQKENCIFCHISEHKVPAKIVHEDDSSIAVLDINPATRGHVLILPKKHYQVMPQVPDREIGHLFKVAKSVAHALLKSLGVQGATVFVANGALAGQKAPHFMLHVIPRVDKDKIPLSLPKKSISPKELQMIRERLAPRIKHHLGYEIRSAGKAEAVKEKKAVDVPKKDGDILDKVSGMFK
ncbi:HIT domain-containing protein [Candidatus Woesearchaeota archaeon]|nr:HIT domain-containing protein [Candidatus Woesearchaeota archaeon]